ncbi:MAG: hypothetical protein AAFW75_24830 [Cyanobacteria bacterium J06636_16]
MSVTALALRQQKAYQNTAAVPALLEDLKVIAELDRIAEVESRRLRQKANTTTGCGCGAAILAFVSFWGASLIGIYVVLVILPAICTAVVCLIWAAQTKRKALYEGELDVPNPRYRFLQRLLPVLQSDMKSKGTLGINLDLSAPDSRPKFVTQLPHPRRRDWKIDFFEDPWLRLKGRYVDSSRFLLTISQRHQIRSGRNVNGKLRTRPRFKGFDLRLDITCTPKLRPALMKFPSLHRAVQLPRGAVLKQVKTTPKGLCIKVRLPEGPFPGFVPASIKPELTYRDPAQLLPSAIANAETAVETALYETSLAMFLSAFQAINWARLRTRNLA